MTKPTAASCDTFTFSPAIMEQLLVLPQTLTARLRISRQQQLGT